MNTRLFVIALFIVSIFSSCEKAILDEVEKDKTPKGNVILSFSPYYQESFTRSTSGLAELFTKLNLMLFDTSNAKVFSQIKTQNSTDDDFGVFDLKLSSGEYKVVAIGHSGTKSASITSLTKVTFTSANGIKNTDTFYYYGTITATDEPQQYNLSMPRGTAMFKLVLTDSIIPNSVVSFKFTYTGGSADINPVTGKGCTNSTQNEYRDTNEGNVYEVYTFPKADEGKLKITVSALDADGDIVKQTIFENVPVSCNVITSYKGCFFNGEDISVVSSSMGFTANGDWNGVNEYEF